MSHRPVTAVPVEEVLIEGVPIMAAPAVVPGDLLEARYMCLMNSQVSVNVLHYLVNSVAAPAPNLLDVADALDNNANILFKNCINNLATYRGVGVSRLTSPRTQEFSSVTRSGTGVAGASALPTQVRGLVAWYSDLAGPRYRGRMYVPFPPTLAAGPTGIPTAAYVAFIAGLIAPLLGPIAVTAGAGSCQLYLVIRNRNGPTPGYRQVVKGVARTRFATQRRSGDFGRPNSLPF